MTVKSNLDLHGKSDAEAIIDGKQIVLKMTGNTNFNSAANPINPPLAAITTAINNLETALAAAQKAGTGPTKTLRQLRHVYDTLATRLSHYVEDTANDVSITDDKRQMILVSAGMLAKTQTHPQKHHFEARNTNVSGTAQLLAEGIHGGRGSHEWQHTADVTGYTNRVSSDSTTTAHTDVHALTSGTKYAFFHKAVTAGAATDWEGPVFLTVT